MNECRRHRVQVLPIPFSTRHQQMPTILVSWQLCKMELGCPLDALLGVTSTRTSQERQSPHTVLPRVERDFLTKHSSSHHFYSVYPNPISPLPCSFHFFVLGYIISLSIPYTANTPPVLSQGLVIYTQWEAA